METQQHPSILVDVNEATRMTSIKRSMLYNLMQGGELASIKVGRRRYIPVAAIHEFIQRHLEASN